MPRPPGGVGRPSGPDFSPRHFWCTFARNRWLTAVTSRCRFIDDMGIKQLPKRSGEYLFEIVLRRYETRSTMMTSNRPLEDWGKLIGDVPSATAILDRFLYHAEIITITGRSYRLKDRPVPQAAAKTRPRRPSEEQRLAKDH